ncbi:MAG: sigma-70 family RNA polymerase sigma factor [Dehalococcoidales bacterium]|nr:sigma-70 family RNA polymerase sigma factor [Dehalococcoidales bacterium]
MDLEQEKELVERARYSPEAFGELYDRYYDQIFGYALRRCANVEIAKDITSGTFLKALRNIKNYRWQGVPFSHWLYRIANHEIVNQYHKEKRIVSYELTANESNAALRGELIAGESELRRHEDYLELQQYISKLPSKYQEVITLKYFEDMDINHIAGVLGKPEGTVKSLLHRGIERLRKMMESRVNK